MVFGDKNIVKHDFCTFQEKRKPQVKKIENIEKILTTFLLFARRRRKILGFSTLTKDMDTPGGGVCVLREIGFCFKKIPGNKAYGAHQVFKKSVNMANLVI